MKRSREDDEHGRHTSKRAKSSSSVGSDRLSSLSHELALRILSSLTVNDLIVCHRVSKHFQKLAGDSQLWKAHYYNRFVRPRASRIPGIRDTDGESSQRLHFSSKLSKWLDEDKLVRKGRDTNWKRQYKLRHNWAQGTCSVSEVPVSDGPSVPPLLVGMRESTIFLADHVDGLRAWNASAGQDMLATLPWANVPGHDVRTPPSALAMDHGKDGNTEETKLMVGFQDGSFALFELDLENRKFRFLYRHEASSNGMLSAVALSYPHLATMSATQLLSVYSFRQLTPSTPLSPPTLIHSLHSASVLPPLTLSLRPSPSASLTVAIAYALPSYSRGWTLGIQELHLDPSTGTVHLSRLATASSSSLPARPSSLAYSHPYLLATHPDNTLTLCLVTSSPSVLEITAPSRLWGHTSAVAAAVVGSRGRAVSVSRAADDVRLWDLESRVGGMGKVAAHAQQSGVRVVAANGAEEEKPGRAWFREWGRPSGHMGETEMCLARGWVGFDEENVVLLKESAGKGQSLVVYDFA